MSVAEEIEQLSLSDLSDYSEDVRNRLDDLEVRARSGRLTATELVEVPELRDDLAVIDKRREKLIGEAAMNPRLVERGDVTHTPLGYGADREVRSIQGEIRDDALRCVDRYRSQDVLSAAAADRLDNVVRHDDPMGLEGRYLSAVGHPDYESAFGKLLQNPEHAHITMTPRELESVRRVQKVMSERAVIEGSSGTGKFGVPVAVDPTILLSSNGAINPIRQLARNFSITTNRWTGVSGSVTATFAAEMAEVGDGTPTLAQPAVDVQKAHVWVPFSIEVGQDYRGLEQELGRIIADAKDVVEAQVFLDGLAASNQPIGLLATTGALSTTQRVLTNSTANVTIVDAYNLKQALPPRHLPNGTFVLSPTALDMFRRFVGGGNTTEPAIVESNNLLNRPTQQWSNMVNTTTSGSKVAVFADFPNAYAIVDRIGLSIELVNTVFGASQRPVGARGVYAYWRTGGGVLVANAARYLEVK
jgi:HK97 family phage major capsid protein